MCSCCIVLAVLPVLIVPIAIGVGVLIVICGIGWGLWRAFHEEHNYLLTGFSGSGKTELHIALSDLVKDGRHTHHADGATPNAYEEIKIAAKRIMVFRDGGGSLHHSEFRKPTYLKFFNEAKSAWVDKYTLLFLIDLSSFSETDHRRYAKSELLFLNEIVKGVFDCHKPDDDDRVKMLVVGTHWDCVSGNRDQVMNDMVADTLKWIDSDYFAPQHIKADLFHDDSAKEFARKLFGVK